ncbi:MAG: DUF748 domain-containing protein, partial [Paludibacteraceae bacterium]|nr:DUF748 domain-containing protein [Paludibacteraceae bacterium]
MNKFVKICIWGALAIVLLFALILALSPAVKYVVNNYGKQLVGREMHVESIVINPYWGGVTIRDFYCKEPNEETYFVTFDRLYVQMAWPRLIAKDVTLRHIHLDGFHGQVLKNEDRVNFSDILERFAIKDTTEQDTTPSGWTVTLRDIRINNSTIRYRDVISDKQWKLEDVSLHIPGLYFDNQQTNAGLEFALPTGGRVGIVAGMKLQANRYAVKIDLHDVHADVALPLVQDYLDLSGLGAILNGSLHIDGSLENVQNIVIKGNLAMKGLCLLDGDKDEVASVDEVRAVINNGDVANNNYLLDSLTITGLTGNYEVHERWNTFTRLRKAAMERVMEREEKNKSGRTDDSLEATEVTEPTGATEPSDSTNNSAKPMSWMAKVVTVTGHDLTYEDYSMKNEWEYAVQTFRVDARNVASSGRNQLNAKATLTNNAQLKIDYVGSLDMKEDNSRLDLKLTGLQITDFSPLCRNYTGYPLESGVLALESHMEVKSGKLKGANTIIIDNPKVGKRERLTKAKYKNIPVRTGFNLLTSAQNKIVLDVPITGDIANPKFKLGKVIGRAMLKVFFGPMMGAKDKDRAILSDEELQEMQTLLSEDSVRPDTTDVAMTAGDTLPPAEPTEE